VYLASLICSSIIPTKWIESNSKKSSEEIITYGGEKEIVRIGNKYVIAFLFTDALMLNTAYSIDTSTPLASPMLARKNYIPGQTQRVFMDLNGNLGASENYKADNGDIYQVPEFYGLMHGENIADSFEYARYWHGYLIFLRPLLVIMDYQGIRILMQVITIILMIVMLGLIAKKIKWQIAVMFLIGFLSIDIFIAARAFNAICVFIIAIVSTIFILLKKDSEKNIAINFFVIGSVTSFIDLLTTPLVTLGIPIIVYLLLIQKNGKNLKECLIELVKICLMWGIGYGLTWATKWILVQLMYNRPIIQNALTQAQVRTVTNKTTFLNMMINIGNFLSYEVIFANIMIMISYAIIMLVKNRNKELNIKNNIVQSIPYLIVAMMPLAWYAVLKQHSMIHRFFTYRALVITIITLMVSEYKILEVKTQDKKEETK
jgi:hypothetical protein